jgi:hypothetical protein
MLRGRLVNIGNRSPPVDSETTYTQKCGCSVLWIVIRERILDATRHEQRTGQYVHGDSLLGWRIGQDGALIAEPASSLSPISPRLRGGGARLRRVFPLGADRRVSVVRRPDRGFRVLCRGRCATSRPTPSCKCGVRLGPRASQLGHTAPPAAGRGCRRRRRPPASAGP